MEVARRAPARLVHHVSRMTAQKVFVHVLLADVDGGGVGLCRRPSHSLNTFHFRSTTDPTMRTSFSMK